MAEENGASFETWMVRIFLVLIFGVAFGIEGRTLWQTYVARTGDAATDSTAQAPPEAPPLVVGDSVQVHDHTPLTITHLALQVTDSAWVFRAGVHVTNRSGAPLRLVLGPVAPAAGDPVATPRPTVALAPGDTASAAGAWSLPAGSRPHRLSVTTTRAPGTDSTTTRTTSLNVSRVPAQR